MRTCFYHLVLFDRILIVSLRTIFRIKWSFTLIETLIYEFIRYLLNIIGILRYPPHIDIRFRVIYYAVWSFLSFSVHTSFMNNNHIFTFDDILFIIFFSNYFVFIKEKIFLILLCSFLLCFFILFICHLTRSDHVGPKGTIEL
jgi:hypothetical protein